MSGKREGFTTGSCAAAAALACCLWLRDGQCPQQVKITVPGGQASIPEILPQHRKCLLKPCTAGCSIWKRSCTINPAQGDPFPVSQAPAGKWQQPVIGSGCPRISGALLSHQNAVWNSVSYSVRQRRGCEVEDYCSILFFTVPYPFV